jgi:hypothetical protein
VTSSTLSNWKYYTETITKILVQRILVTKEDSAFSSDNNDYLFSNI